MQSFRRFLCCGGALFASVCRKIFGNSLADFRHACDVIVMRVRDKQMLELKLIFRNNFQNRRGVPAGVEQRGFARDLVPNQIAMHRVAAFGRADLPELPPHTQIFLRWQPAVGNDFQLGGIQSQ